MSGYSILDAHLKIIWDLPALCADPARALRPKNPTLLLYLSVLLSFSHAVGQAKIQAQPRTNASGHSRSAAIFRVELTNNLGVTATVGVTGFTAGRDVIGDSEDPYTAELDALGGKWSARDDSTRSLTVAFPNGVQALNKMGSRRLDHDFAEARLVVALDKGFVLVPWRSFKALSFEQGSQVITLNDGTQWKGTLRTILTGNSSSSENKVWELSGVRSLTVVQMPVGRTVSQSQANSHDLHWIVAGPTIPEQTVTRLRFVQLMNDKFVITQQFQIGPDINSPPTSATLSDFQSVSIERENSASWGVPVTVKAKNAAAVSGLLAFENHYLEGNGSFDLAGDLDNNCTVVFAVFRGERLTLTKAE